MEPIGYDKKKGSKLMQDKGVDILIASSSENVFYTSGIPVGYAESNPILYVLFNQYPSIVIIPQDGEEALITWQLFRSVESVSWVRKVVGILSRSEALQRLESLIEETGLPQDGTIGIESGMPYYQFYWLTKVFPDVKIRVSDDIFTDMRLEKSEEEIRRIKESTRIAEKTVETMIGYAKEGVSDTDLVRVARRRIIDEETAGVNHITLGIGSSDPEYPKTGITMKKGDLVRFDVGAIHEGYCSDVARYAIVGTYDRSAETANKLMIEVQRACVDAIKPGVKPLDAVNAAYNVYRRGGGEAFFFLSIHSVGLSIEECTLYDTVLGASPIVFKKSMVIDVDCSTVFPPQGLIGVGDPYLVTDSGCKELSTLERRIYRV
ncbi:MAG: M24 family metallopeptidase [Candidatus Atabeyarchaeum deiterrae]